MFCFSSAQKTCIQIQKPTINVLSVFLLSEIVEILEILSGINFSKSSGCALMLSFSPAQKT